MPEIAPGLPPTPPPPGPQGPAVTLGAGALAGLTPGQNVAARVLASLGGDRYALLVAGQEVVATSPLALATGDQLQLSVRRADTQVLMDLIPLHHAFSLPAASEDAPAQAATARSADPAQPQAQPAPSSQQEVQAALRRAAPLGELLGESLRALEAAATAAPAGTAPAVREVIDSLRQLLVNPAADGAGAKLAAVAASAPAQVAALVNAVEGELAAAIRALPQVAALGVLLDALESLPAPAPTSAAATSSAQPQAQTQDTSALLSRLLDSLKSSGQEPAALTPAVREALEKLPPPERAALRALAAEQERSALAASPQVASLTAAHRALASAQERLDLGRMLNMPTVNQTQSYSYLELPLASGAGAEAGSARLSVMLREPGDGESGGRGKSGRGTSRAVLDLSLSSLGTVWSELTLSGRTLAVRLELPDETRRAFVAGHLPELEERLAAHGLEASVSAATARPRRAAPDEPGGEPAADGGLSLWA